ncbi:hypothetical protein SAMN05216559_0343 [Halomicrobium zhouii]|uniref:Uncharacterized protein n=1 Tax=Halomicrobium zhouii TaxID=767519 RepID=A0A1I6K7W4_9EURY|nr:hypothetical protein [Halomicrobium zhouii]SFR87355.1 hypothetical protein SAMN05216559_0343 [Halomicrobium zhouii]
MTASQAPVPRSSVAASVAVLALTTLAAAVGLFVPGFYRDAPVLLPQVYGQDLLTLAVAVPAYAVALFYATRGSLRGYVAWLGITGYLLYTYASYAFMTAFNELYLAYVALLWLTLYTFVAGMARLDAGQLKRAVGERSVWPAVAFQLLLVVLVGGLWLAEILPATLAGTTPPSIAEADLPTSAIYSLDLGVVVPAFALSAYRLWRRDPWGYAFTAVLLVKVATLGGAVLAMVWFVIRDGQPVPLPQIVIFGTLTLLSLVLVTRFLLAIDGEKRVRRERPTSETAGE